MAKRAARRDCTTGATEIGFGVSIQKAMGLSTSRVKILVELSYTRFAQIPDRIESAGITVERCPNEEGSRTSSVDFLGLICVALSLLNAAFSILSLLGIE